MPARGAGARDAQATAAEAGAALGCPAEQVLVSSTGVIGVHLDRKTMLAGVHSAAAALSRDGAPAARGIMTTDLAPKEHAVQIRDAEGRVPRRRHRQGRRHDRADAGDDARVHDDRREGRAGAAGQGASRSGGPDVQRDHGRRRVFDQRHAGRARQRGQRRHDRRGRVSRAGRRGSRPSPARWPSPSSEAARARRSWWRFT